MLVRKGLGGNKAISPPIAWVLGGSLLASAWALWWPDGSPAVHPMPVSVAVVAGVNEAPVQQSGVLPTTLPKVELVPAEFDPFVGVVPKEPPPAKPAAAPPPQYVPPPPVVVPTQTYRFLGKLASPDGKLLVYLTNGMSEVVVGEGTRLDDGFVVDSIQSDAVFLVHPVSGTRAQIAIPVAAQS